MNLPKYAGTTTPIVYSAAEPTVPAGYTSAVTGSAADGFTITNSYTPETTKVGVTKIWADQNDADGIRPRTVEITVTGSDGKSYTKTVYGQGNTWAGEFTVAKYHNHGQLVTFTADETMTGVITGVDGPGTYAKKVAGMTITNTHTPMVVITYKLNGGRYAGSHADIVEYYPKGTVITIHAAPTRSGYRFLYWLGSQYNPGDKYTANADHTFVAQWEYRGYPWSPQTGDHTPWLPWLGVLLLSGAALGIDAVVRKRKRKGEE